MSWRAGCGAAASLAALAAYAFWLLAHPASVPSDDAFFFVRAVTRFSVLELSPHFPGYPAFVLAARAVDVLLHDPARSVLVVGALAALSIPVALYAWVHGAGVARGFAWAAAAAALFQPSLPGVALSMLSDPLGIALALWCLVALQAECFLAGGVLMGLCIAARPSYAVLALATFAALLALRRSALVRFGLGFAAVGAAAAGFVLSADGLAYFDEGLRFGAGHFGIWGRGAGAPDGWGRDLVALLGGGADAAIGATALAFALRSLRARELATAVALCMALAYAVWILCAQNPDSARHATPLVFLALGIAAIGLGQGEPRRAAALAALLVAAALHGFATSVERGRLPSPLERASAEIDGRDVDVLVTQWGVEWMRARHSRLRILDPYYAASTQLAARSASEEGEVLRLSTSPLGAPWLAVRTLPARFPGERSLALYRLHAPDDGR